MSENSFPPFSLDSEFQVDAYAKWFLRLPVETIEGEFAPAEWRKFLVRRELRLKAELDDLIHLKFASPHLQSAKKVLFQVCQSNL